jgi:hypothetical protein
VCIVRTLLILLRRAYLISSCVSTPPANSCPEEVLVTRCGIKVILVCSDNSLPSGDTTRTGSLKSLWRLMGDRPCRFPGLIVRAYVWVWRLNADVAHYSVEASV